LIGKGSNQVERRERVSRGQSGHTSLFAGPKRRWKMTRFRVGLVILILGVALLLASGITYTTQERTKIGPITMEIPEHHQIPYMPVAGGLLILTGGALMLFRSGRTA
jgi:hypothetical protein